MLEGLEITIVNTRDVFDNDKYGRIDAEFNTKKNISLEKNLRRIDVRKIADVSVVTDGEHGSPVLDENSGIVYLSGNNIKENIIDFENIRFCSKELHEKNLRSSVKKDTVLMSIVGTVGKASIVYEDVLANTDRNVATIKNINNEFVPGFISTFLNSKYGFFQTQRFSTGNVQPLLNLLQVKSIIVPKLSLFFQKSIETVIKKAFLIKKESKNAYDKSEYILLETLGLKDFETNSDAVNIKGFKESFLSTGRLDAEYYQKKYDILEKKIKSTTFKRIEEIRTDNYRGMQPVYIEDGEIDVINSKHILESSLDYERFEKTSSEYWDKQKRARVSKGDILTYTTGANIGRTQVYLSDKKALASNHVNILRLNGENPYYIGFVLNSVVGRLQTEKFSAGSAQAELYPKDIDEFIVPIIEKSLQEKIIDLFNDSFHLKKESEQLLDLAKRAVEVAIEEGEEKAMEMIENHK